MNGERKFLLQIVVVASLGICVGYSALRLAKGKEVRAGIVDGSYDFDDKLPPQLPREARLTQGQRLALLLGVTLSSPVPEYLSILQRKYAHEELKVLVVLPPDSPNGLRLFTNALGVSSVVDHDGRFRRLLRYSSGHGHDAVLIYDNAYRVKFHLLANPDNDLLRQLVEKYLVGRITYRPSELSASTLIGRKIEGLQCAAEPAPSKGVFVIFPPGAPRAS